ncbi:regulator of G-protein signaling 18 [Eublepharis macularius]|uniref:Regulator of G-protein signaling 18 n=1 Tax=Eublepharis macularius TaxID=481883 RepID=A0AA97JJ49_EUBMA|nr:regulator of G-protein signaling 18 [Eublepharis macularius]
MQKSKHVRNDIEEAKTSTVEETSELPTDKAAERKMENPLLLSPQLSASSRMKLLCKSMKPSNKDAAKTEAKNRAQEKKNRLSLLLKKSELHPNPTHLDTFDKLTNDSSESPEEIKKWGESFDKLISQKAGMDTFTRFLKSEFSEENIEFWLACEDFKKTKDPGQLSHKAKEIYKTFIEKNAPKEVNLDFNTKECANQNISCPTINSFDAAQTKIYTLMEQDSYPRFLRSNLYLDLLNGRPLGYSALRRRSRSFTFNEFKDAQPDFAIWL